MLENNFDKEIRNKLESIEPEFKPEAWQKLKKALPMPWYMSFFKTYGGWLFGGVSTALLLFSTFSNSFEDATSQSVNNDLVQETIETLKYDTVYIKKTDTVFLNRTIIKKVYVNNDIAIKNKGANNFSKPNDNVINNEKAISSLKQEGLSLKSNSDNTLDYIKIYEELVAQKSQSEPTQSLTAEDQIDEVKNTEKVETPKVAELAIEDKPLEIQASKKFKLKDINARLGVSSNYLGNSLFSLGPEIEIFLNQRLSIGTSLQISGHKDIKYSVPREFNVGTGKEFEARYEKFIKEKPQKIENISIRTNVIRLPVFLTYYVPINYKLSFLINTGTRLNLNVSESVTFTGERFGVKSKSNFDSQYKPAVFNNLYYGTGIQYQYNRLYAQISPYFEFSFNRNSFLIPPKRFGINASVKFGIGK